MTQGYASLEADIRIVNSKCISVSYKIKIKHNSAHWITHGLTSGPVK